MTKIVTKARLITVEAAPSGKKVFDRVGFFTTCKCTLEKITNAIAGIANAGPKAVGFIPALYPIYCYSKALVQHYHHYF